MSQRQLRANCAAYMRCPEIVDACSVPENDVDNALLLAHNADSIFQLHLTDLCVTLLHKDFKQLNFLLQGHWQQFFPRLTNDDDVTVVACNYFTVLLRSNKTGRYWLHSRHSYLPLDCISLEQTLKEEPLSCVFLQADKALVLLFESEIRVDTCADWWRQTSAVPTCTAKILADEYDTLLSDNVSHIVAYGRKKLTCFTRRLVQRWSTETFISPIALCWLSTTGFVVFCLLDNGVLCALDRADGTKCAESIQLEFECGEFDSLKAFACRNIDNQYYLLAQNTKTHRTRLQMIQC